MGIRIKKVLGYGTQDMAGDLGITRKQLSKAYDRDYLDFVKFVEDFLNHKPIGIDVEYLGAILHRFETTTPGVQDFFADNTRDWTIYDYKDSHFFDFIHHDDEGGDANTVVFSPTLKHQRRDDDIDYQEYHCIYGRDGDYEPKVLPTIAPIYPWSYMMRRNPTTPWGIETYFPPSCYLNIPGEVDKHIPYVPYNIKLMLDYIAGKDMIEGYMKLRPMVYTYWS